MDTSIMEKLWLVYECENGSEQDKIDKALSLFTKEEKATTTAKWLEKRKSDLDWDDNIYDLVDNVLSLPLCPQKYRDDTWTPLETKLKDKDFADYYKKYQDRLNKVKAKHNY